MRPRRGSYNKRKTDRIDRKGADANHEIPDPAAPHADRAGLRPGRGGHVRPGQRPGGGGGLRIRPAAAPLPPPPAAGEALHLLRRRPRTVLAGARAAAALSALANAPAVAEASASSRQLPIYCVQRDQKMLSISFDAAWGDVKLRHPG